MVIIAANYLPHGGLFSMTYNIKFPRLLGQIAPTIPFNGFYHVSRREGLGCATANLIRRHLFASCRIISHRCNNRSYVVSAHYPRVSCYSGYLFASLYLSLAAVKACTALNFSVLPLFSMQESNLH